MSVQDDLWAVQPAKTFYPVQRCIVWVYVFVLPNSCAPPDNPYFRNKQTMYVRISVPYSSQGVWPMPHRTSLFQRFSRYRPPQPDPLLEVVILPQVLPSPQNLQDNEGPGHPETRRSVLEAKWTDQQPHLADADGGL